MKCIIKHTKEIFDILMIIALVLFGWFIIYQVLRKVSGGSWISESLIIALLMFNIGYTLKLGNEITELKIEITRIRADLHNLTLQFQSLAHDFKEHLKYHR